jgi:hypothetical protein
MMMSDEIKKFYMGLESYSSDFVYTPPKPTAEDEEIMRQQNNEAIAAFKDTPPKIYSDSERDFIRQHISDSEGWPLENVSVYENGSFSVITNPDLIIYLRPSKDEHDLI